MKAMRLKFVLLGLLLGLHVLLGSFPQIMADFGVGRSGIWFRDMHAMLAASDAAREGLDPFVSNPYDLGGERHIYPDWWFALDRLALGRADSYWLGLVVIGLFWLAVLAVLPLRSGRELGWSLLVCASPPFWLAVNRANPDLLIFALLTPVVPLLLHRRPWVRFLPPGLVALATGLKFFPALAGVAFLAPAGTRREWWQRWLLIAVLVGFLAWSLTDDIQRYLAAGWIARGLFSFGAAVIPLNFGWNAEACVTLARLTGAALVLWAVLRRPDAFLRQLDEREQRFGVMGAAVLAGMFFLTVGYLYKIIFAVWLLPVLLSLSGAAGPWRRRAQLALLCLVAMVWIEGLVCAGLSLLPAHSAGSGGVLMRRLAATLCGGLAWGFVLPTVIFFGAQLRSYWQQWQGSASPAGPAQPR